jgi:DinB family
MAMPLTELFLQQLEYEAGLTRKAVEKVPEGKNDWKPHEKSMPLGYLASLCATMPSWVATIVDFDELDLAKPGPSGEGFRPREWRTNGELVAMVDESLERGRTSLKKATDAHLALPWRFLVAGRVIDDRPRYAHLRDSVFGHLSHHRGQLTVYLRLSGATVPALYGPSADEQV